MFANGSGPELALIWAVLERALQDASGVVDSREWSQRNIINKAKAWLFTWKEDDAKVPFTFVWICLHLDLDHAEVSRKARLLITRRLSFSRKRQIRAGRAFAYQPTRTEGEVYYG